MLKKSRARELERIRALSHMDLLKELIELAMDVGYATGGLADGSPEWVIFRMMQKEMEERLIEISRVQS